MPLPRRLWGLREGFPSFGPAWGGRKALEALPVPGSMASLQTGAPHTQPPLAVWKHCAPEALTQASGVVELLRGGHKDLAALWGPPDVPVTERPPPPEVAKVHSRACGGMVPRGGLWPGTCMWLGLRGC